MSYILDALRKAERDHQVSRIPTLATAHGAADRRRASWIWPVAGGALAASAVVAVVAYTLHWAPAPPARRDPVGDAKPPAMSAVAARPDPGAAAPPLAPASERTLAPTDVTGPPAEHPAGAPTSSGPGVAPSASAPSARHAGRAAPDVRSRPGRMGASAPSARRPPAAVAPRPASPPIDRDSAPEPGPTGETRAQPVLAAVPVPPSDGGSGRTALPAPAQGLPRLTLDVLVYSDVPAERLVFINGRKYVEGQVLDDGGVVEQITPEGAILRREGKQIVLRPKLNPYVRPGSP